MSQVTENKVCFCEAEDIVNKTTRNQVSACRQLSIPHQSFQLRCFHQNLKKSANPVNRQQVCVDCTEMYVMLSKNKNDNE